MPHTFREYRAAHRSPRPDAAACSDCFDTPMAVVPAAIRDDMSFAEMCETLKAYCASCPALVRASAVRSAYAMHHSDSRGKHRASAERGGHETYDFESGRAACREECCVTAPTRYHAAC